MTYREWAGIFNVEPFKVVLVVERRIGHVVVRHAGWSWWPRQRLLERHETGHGVFC